MSDDDELAREEAYIAKITARKNQKFESKVFGGGLEAARTGTGSSGKFGGGASSGSFGGGGGLEAARAAAAAGKSPNTSGRFGGRPEPPVLRGGLEAARAAKGLEHPSTVTYATPTPAYTPTPISTPASTPTPAPTPAPAPISFPPLTTEIIELTVDLPGFSPPIAQPVASEAPTTDRGLFADSDAIAAREEARMEKLLGGGGAQRPSVLDHGSSKAAPVSSHSTSLPPPKAAAVSTPQAAAPIAPAASVSTPQASAATFLPLQEWEKSPLTAQYGTKFENLILAEILSARMNPQSLISALEQRKSRYDGTHLKDLHSNSIIATQEGTKAVDDAINYLRALPALGSNSHLRVEVGLCESARDFCALLKTYGTVESESDASDRLYRYGSYDGQVLQDVAFGNFSAEEVVLDWIIDDGAASRGRPHRASIFDSTMHCIGIATGPNNVGRVTCALFTEAYRPNSAGSSSPSSSSAPAQSSAPTPVAQSASAPVTYPEFVVGQLEQAQTANVLPISNLGCGMNDLSVALRKNGNQIEFRRSVSHEGRIFNLPYQVTQQTCSATFSSSVANGTLRIILGKPQATDAASEFEICQYTIKGDPASSHQRVQIAVDQSNHEYYDFVPGPPCQWDTAFTVALKDLNLMFKGTFSQPEGGNTKVINSTQTVGLPVPPPREQIELIDLPGGGKTVRVWNKPRPGFAPCAQTQQPDCDITISQV